MLPFKMHSFTFVYHEKKSDRLTFVRMSAIWRDNGLEPHKERRANERMNEKVTRLKRAELSPNERVVPGESWPRIGGGQKRGFINIPNRIWKGAWVWIQLPLIVLG